jgi:Domain of unknown function (DUF397)
MMVPDTRGTWHKSSYSSQTDSCVEVRNTPDGADMRDTKNREGGRLSVQPHAWRAFLASVTR